jgi:hypothetical protein
MSDLLTWPLASVVYIHCGMEMRWNTFRGCYECASPTCGSTR